MKQADLQVGHDYALPTYEPYDAAPLAARVSVVSVDGGGKVTVKVIDPGAAVPRNAWNARPFKRNEKRQVATRIIACSWDEWADRAASIGAEREARVAEQQKSRDDFEQRIADRIVIDAEREMPEKYDEEFFDFQEDAEERIALSKVYFKARSFGPYGTSDELMPLLAGLPIPVLRDIFAAAVHRRSGSGNTVIASVFMRSAGLLEDARIASIDRLGGSRGNIQQPRQLLGEADVAFVNALRDQISVRGGEITLPPIPPLPGWVREEERAFAPIFGWLRLAIGDTGGQMLHSSACRSVRSCPVLFADHMPWWQVMLENPRRVCGICYGPCIRDLVPMAGFVAAADVWEYRGRDRIERWQQAAFQRLLTATAAARADALEPDITLAHRITAALYKDAPAEEGWAAYALVAARYGNGLGSEVEQLTPRQQETARVLVRDRLSAIEAALPAIQRPLPLPQNVDVRVLRERYDYIIEMLDGEVPQLDRLLFTLPGAR